MNIALITGSAGLIGGEAAEFFSKKGFRVVGIDNDMRKYFFGPDASTEWNRKRLEGSLKNYTHKNIDIRNLIALENVFKEFSRAGIAESSFYIKKREDVLYPFVHSGLAHLDHIVRLCDNMSRHSLYRRTRRHAEIQPTGWGEAWPTCSG